MIEASEPFKRTVQRTQQIVLKQAGYRKIDTGKKQVVTIIDENGNQSTQEQPIYDEVYIAPIYDTQQIDVDVWIVTTTFGGESEDHEFATLESATAYYNEVK